MTGAAVRNILVSNAAITALIASRIYPLILPQGSPFPAVTYNIVSNNPLHCKNGAASQDEIRLSLNIWSRKYEEAEAIAEASRNALDNYAGISKGQTINKIQIINEVDLYEEEPNVYHKVLDFKILKQR